MTRITGEMVPPACVWTLGGCTVAVITRGVGQGFFHSSVLYTLTHMTTRNRLSVSSQLTRMTAEE